eukprot:4560315-Amphidinium_carterae.1
MKSVVIAEALLQKWPAVQNLCGDVVILEAGDALVIPQGVWHHVHSLDPLKKLPFEQIGPPISLTNRSK